MFIIVGVEELQATVSYCWKHEPVFTIFVLLYFLLLRVPFLICPQFTFPTTATLQLTENSTSTMSPERKNSSSFVSSYCLYSYE